MRKLICLVALAGALIAGLVSLGLLVAGFMVPSLTGAAGGGLEGGAAAATPPAFGLLGLVLAATMAVAAWSAFRERPAGPLRLAPWGLLALLTLVTLLVGQYIVSRPVAPLTPVVHVVAGLLPAMLILSLTTGAAARRHGPRPLQRSVGASFAWGGLGGAGLAIVLEMAITIVLGLLVYLGLEATEPGIGQRLLEWANGQVGSGGGTPDLGPLLRLTSSPVLVLSLFALFGAVAPLVEEFTKALAVPFVVASGRDLSRLDGFLLGVAAGAGFAAVEAVGYGLMGLAAPSSWAVVMVLRGGTAAIHCLAAGLVGLGWQAILNESNWARGLGFGLLGLALHSAWNVGAGLQMVLSLQSIAGGNVAAPGPVQALGLLVITGGMLLIVAGAVVALPLIAARLSHTAQAPAAVPLPAGGEE